MNFAAIHSLPTPTESSRASPHPWSRKPVSSVQLPSISKSMSWLPVEIADGASGVSQQHRCHKMVLPYQQQQQLGAGEQLTKYPQSIVLANEAVVQVGDIVQYGGSVANNFGFSHKRSVTSLNQLEEMDTGSDDGKHSNIRIRSLTVQAASHKSYLNGSRSRTTTASSVPTAFGSGGRYSDKSLLQSLKSGLVLQLYELSQMQFVKIQPVKPVDSSENGSEFVYDGDATVCIPMVRLYDVIYHEGEYNLVNQLPRLKEFVFRSYLGSHGLFKGLSTALARKSAVNDGNGIIAIKQELPPLSMPATMDSVKSLRDGSDTQPSISDSTPSVSVHSRICTVSSCCDSEGHKRKRSSSWHHEGRPNMMALLNVRYTSIGSSRSTSKSMKRAVTDSNGRVRAKTQLNPIGSRRVRGQSYRQFKNNSTDVLPSSAIQYLPLQDERVSQSIVKSMDENELDAISALHLLSSRPC
ncbi:hypothetical protein MIR68_004172 [Amoeboaphelidium protococcarum]|nr:hypothetical protein MIR68_004172 [Amoeboaphelidium protococcarum]